MKCESVERWILLEQSGELSDWKRRRLQAHLESCEHCRRFQEDSVFLTRVAEDSAPPGEISEFTIERIKSAGRESIAAREPGFKPRRAKEPFVVSWKPALVYATLGLLVLAAGSLFLMQLRQGPVEVTGRKTPLPPELIAWNGELDEQIDQLDSLLASIAADREGSDLFDDSLSDDEIALELLQLEGS